MLEQIGKQPPLKLKSALCVYLYVVRTKTTRAHVTVGLHGLELIMCNSPARGVGGLSGPCLKCIPQGLVFDISALICCINLKMDIYIGFN